MTKTQEYKIVENRLEVIKNRPDAYKCPGVIRKLERQLRNLSK